MVVDLRDTGPYDGLSSYVALVPTMTDFCTVIKGCSVFLLFFWYICFVLVFPDYAIK